MKQRLQYFNSETINQIALFLLLLVCYTYFFPRWADPNQNSRLDMVVAVVDDGTFQIDKYVHNTVDYAKVEEHYYSDKAPGAAFLGLPVYFGLRPLLELPVIDSLMTQLANNQAFKASLRENGSGILKQKVRFALAQIAITFVVAILPSVILGTMMYRLLGYFALGWWSRLALVLGYGLLTPAFAYAGAFMGHQLSAALLFGAFYMVFVVRLNVQRSIFSVQRLFIIGVLLGYSVITEYPTLLIVAILYLYTFYALYERGQWLKIGWVTLAGGLVAIGWMVYNTLVFGGPLELGYSHSELWQEQHHTGFMSLSLPHWPAIWGITFSLFRGLFILSPWLLLAVPGFWLWWRSAHYRPEFWSVLTSVVAIFFFNSSSIMWWGGFAIGPRYLLPALPFIVLAVAFVCRQWGHRVWLKALFVILFGWSLIAVWGLTLAEQAFPSDTIYNPLLEYAWPNWQDGNIARNLGTILGLQGLWSLIPLLSIIILIGVGWWLIYRWHGIDFRVERANSTDTLKQNPTSAQ